MLEIKNITKIYKSNVVLDDVSFSVEEGTVCGLFGVNGAGKSTLMKILCGLINAEEGEVLYKGKPFIHGEYPKVGAMIESPSFLDHLTAYENLIILAELSKYKISKNDVINALKTVGLFKVHDKQYKEFSLGMKQRLYLASVLMLDADIIVLDEPFRGIDPIVLKRFEDIIFDLAHEKGKLVLISSHEIRELDAIVDKAVFIENGKIIYENNNAKDIDIFDTFINKSHSSGNIGDRYESKDN